MAIFLERRSSHGTGLHALRWDRRRWPVMQPGWRDDLEPYQEPHPLGNAMFEPWQCTPMIPTAFWLVRMWDSIVARMREHMGKDRIAHGWHPDLVGDRRCGGP